MKKTASSTLKQLRLRQGLSLQNLAELLGSSAATLMRIEHGGLPRGALVLRLQRWADELGEDIAWPRPRRRR